jgi:protein-arginine kinase activator protein McsA
MVSKLGLNNSLVKKEMELTLKTGHGANDIELSRNRISRKCYKCGQRFVTFTRKNFVFCADCGKIRRGKEIKKGLGSDENVF